MTSLRDGKFYAIISEFLPLPLKFGNIKGQYFQRFLFPTSADSDKRSRRVKAERKEVIEHSTPVVPTNWG